MRYDEMCNMVEEFSKILNNSSTKAQFSLNCVLNGSSHFLSHKFNDFLFKLFTLQDLDLPILKLKMKLMPNFRKITDFYSDGKIILESA